MKNNIHRINETRETAEMAYALRVMGGGKACGCDPRCITRGLINWFRKRDNDKTMCRGNNESQADGGVQSGDGPVSGGSAGGGAL